MIDGKKRKCRKNTASRRKFMAATATAGVAEMAGKVQAVAGIVTSRRCGAVNCWNVLTAVLVVAMVFVFAGAPAAYAQEDADARIERLEAALKALQSELAELKAERAHNAARPAPVVDQEKIDQMVNKAIEQRTPQPPATPDWVNSLKWSGDFRYRHEYTDDETRSSARNRHRIRVRLGLDATVNDEWDLGFRIATGSSDSPTSTNQTLGESSPGSDSSAFSKKNIWLDLAYADHHPEWLPGGNLVMGKMKNPFYSVGKSQLIWDSDVNPEGIAAKYTWDLDDSTSAYLNGGGFWVREEAGDGDISLWGAQAYAKHKQHNDNHILGGVSYYDYGHLRGVDEDDIGISLRGNTPLPGTDRWASDFDILEGFAEYGFKVGQMPVALFGNYARNTASSTSEDTAWLVGFSLNEAREPGSWQFNYDYRDTEADSVVGGFTESDFIDGGTVGKGHKLGMKYQWTENIRTDATYFDNDKGISKDDFRRLQLDLILKF